MPAISVLETEANRLEHEAEKCKRRANSIRAREAEARHAAEAQESNAESYQRQANDCRISINRLKQFEDFLTAKAAEQEKVRDEDHRKAGQLELW